MISKLAHFTMVESGIGGQFWFSAALTAKDARNEIFKDHCKMNPWEMLDTFNFRAWGCKAWVYLNKDRRGNGKHLLCTVEAINLGFATDHDMSTYKVFVPEGK